MSKIYLLLTFIFLICRNAEGQDIKASFQKEYHNFNIDTSIRLAVPLGDKFYCLKSNGSIFVITKVTNSIDSSYKDNSRQLNLLNLYVRGDSLIGLSKNKNYLLNSQNNWIPLNKPFSVPPLFEDDKFLVASTCSGEWGGSVYFKDKRTKKVYTAQAACVVNVKKVNDKYNITATLAHLSGFGNVFDVKDPLLLAPYNPNLLKGKKIIYVGDNESKSTKGTTQLVDSVGIESVSSFVYKKQMFYLVSNNNKTFITTIQNNKFVNIDQLSEFSIWSYYPINRTYGDQTIYSFGNYQTSGFITIENNKLDFYSFNWKHN
ncbi:hypothetical protein ACEN9X_24015 [Mucilaginibacter sp. Mucisp86]|uniref:hypothetical protein n=1 Tax=Mucilaginibacter sp. Mucisp86 TaxID=3243060 RepID=UPI0039B68102